ncbi:zf-C3HC-domain-containing protein [Obba rivulosa]|uniref:Zf-C3HC-domain-containing protein n=1 Tax=Obba rivulosa TaxID=1052685 RepID=A0A8E2DRF4_9APHY|nr:zf-C3HC-domain-containing protein [Obba rivulosa]
MRTVGHSLYSTLAKYGIKKDAKTTKDKDEVERLSKTAPHLAAILARSVSRSRKARPSSLLVHAPPTSARSTADYRPSSIASFLSRLATFRLSTYSNKPPAIDAVAAAKCGWINDGKDRLVCGICDVSWVVADTRGMTRDAANVLIEKQRAQLVATHKDGCPWKVKQCDDTIYRIPLQTPHAMAKEIKARALALDPVLQGVDVKHPMASSQVQALVSTIHSVNLPNSGEVNGDRSEFPPEEPFPPINHNGTQQAQPSATAVLAALFGWSIAPHTQPPDRASPPSLSRASSVAPATPGRMQSRSSSVVSFRDNTPGPSTPRPPLQMMPSTPGVPAQLISGPTRPDTTILHCALCQRRIGLWAFLPPRNAADSVTSSSSPGSQGTPTRLHPQRQLDLLKEHRSYCPYVVRSTVLPTPPAPPPSATSNGRFPPAFSSSSLSQLNGQPDAVDGWRAVLTVVLRYGMAQRQRLRLKRLRLQREEEEEGEPGADGDAAMTEAEPIEVDRVEAMMAGVKSRGGKDLLRYVKGLLG